MNNERRRPSLPVPCMARIILTSHLMLQQAFSISSDYRAVRERLWGGGSEVRRQDRKEKRYVASSHLIVLIINRPGSKQQGPRQGKWTIRQLGLWWACLLKWARPNPTLLIWEKLHQYHVYLRRRSSEETYLACHRRRRTRARGKPVRSLMVGRPVSEATSYVSAVRRIGSPDV